MAEYPRLVSKVSKRLNEYKEYFDIDYTEISRRTGISLPSISRYAQDHRAPKIEVVQQIADGLEVDLMWLVGYNVPMRREDWKPTSVEGVEMQSVPKLGAIAAGIPITAEENYESYVKCGAHIDCDFCLDVKGDSMIGDNIRDGYVVFIKKQDMVQNGQIAAVLIGDEATLKHVYYTGTQLTLVASNPAYPPMVYTGSELANIRILGRAVAFQAYIA